MEGGIRRLLFLARVQDDAEAQRQIQQMVKFILNEARDKAQEIEARSLEDFNIEKLKLVQQMKDKIRQEYDKKAKKLETQRAMYALMSICTCSYVWVYVAHTLLRSSRLSGVDRLSVSSRAEGADILFLPHAAGFLIQYDLTSFLLKPRKCLSQVLAPCLEKLREG